MIRAVLRFMAVYRVRDTPASWVGSNDFSIIKTNLDEINIPSEADWQAIKIYNMDYFN